MGFVSVFFLNIGSFNNAIVNGLPIQIKFFIVAIFAPVIETLLFQTIFIEMFLVNHNNSTNIIIVILVSSLAFAATHLFSFFYAIFAFLMGINLASTYIVFQGKKPNSTLTVISIHASYNLIMFVISEWIAPRL
jgi:hypothetical protein